MKLFSAYNRILVITSFLGLVLIGLLFHRTLSYYLNQQMDRYLVEELMEVQDYTHSRNILPAPYLFDDLVIEYERIPQLRKGEKFSDTVYYNPKKKQRENARYLQTYLQVNSQPYRVLIIASKVKSDEQAKSILLVILLPVLLLFLVIMVFSRFLMRRLWKPFRQLLVNIQSLSLSKDRVFEPVETPVQEFQELNRAIADISEKLRSDYQEIKLFTENASHEMMTPLAVINSKLDTLLQSSSLNKEESETLTDLYRATSRLTKLNQSLLLLVKIDNDLMHQQEDIDLTELLKEKISYFQDMVQRRNISLITVLQPFLIRANRQLLEVMVNNLFSNAIRHNYDGGTIELTLDPKGLCFCNTSPLAALDSSRIFERFYKDGASEGTGLGLAILKQICLRQHFDLQYSYTAQKHCFSISFPGTPAAL